MAENGDVLSSEDEKMTSYDSDLNDDEGCKIGMRWKIKEQDFRNLKDDNDIESARFKASCIPGIRYSLSVEFRTDENKYYIFLQFIFSIERKIKAVCKVSIRSTSSEIEFDDTFTKEQSTMGYSICTRDELNDPAKTYFVDGIMIVELEGTLYSEGVKPIQTETISLAKILWDRDDDKDITIVAQDQNIKFHKWILIASSTVFERELTNSNFQEATENKIITQFPAEIINRAKEYFYERDISDKINEENAFELLRFADYYDVKSLHNLVQKYLIQNLSETTVSKFANWSITTNARVLRENCICFLMKFVGKPTVIDGIKDLHDEIVKEVGRRSFFSTSE